MAHLFGWCIVCLWRQLFHLYCAPSFICLFLFRSFIWLFNFKALFLCRLSKVIVNTELWLNYMFIPKVLILVLFLFFFFNFFSLPKTVWRGRRSILSTFFLRTRNYKPDSYRIIFLVYLFYSPPNLSENFES